MLTGYDEAGLRTTYEAILKSVARPVVVWDASGYLGNPFPIRVQAELFRRHPDRVLFKLEAPLIGPKISRLFDLLREQCPKNESASR